MSMLANSAPALSQQIVVSLPSAVGGESFTSFAPGTYDVYWKMSPMSLRLGRCRMTSGVDVAERPRAVVVSASHATERANSAAPNAMLLIFMAAHHCQDRAKLRWSNIPRDVFWDYRGCRPLFGIMGVTTHTACRWSRQNAAPTASDTPAPASMPYSRNSRGSSSIPRTRTLFPRPPRRSAGQSPRSRRGECSPSSPADTRGRCRRAREHRCCRPAPRGRCASA